MAGIYTFMAKNGQCTRKNGHVFILCSLNKWIGYQGTFTIKIITSDPPLLASIYAIPLDKREMEADTQNTEVDFR